MTRSRALVDAGWASVITAINLANVLGAADPPGGVAANLVYPLLLGGLILLRRRHPVGTGLAFAAASVPQALFLLTPKELAGSFLCVLVFPYTAGAEARHLRALCVPAAVASLACVLELADDGLTLTDVGFPTALAIASFLAGRAVQGRTRLAAELHEAAVRAEEAREAETQEAVAAERRRIARELHDVVAHSMSVMVVQAGGARRIMGRDAARAEAAAAQIERTGREALVEMRRLLGFLQPAENLPARAPQPGLDGLDRLVARSREAGLPVTLRVEGERRPLPAGLDLTAYRIVQEALTNALRHADAAPTEVRLRWRDDALEIAVTDRGAGRPAGPPAGPGHGLIGMRERARIYGGEVHTGPLRGGGYEVRARLPFATEEVTA